MQRWQDSKFVLFIHCGVAAKAVGAWPRVNGEAIYGADRTPFGIEFAGEAKAKKPPTNSTRPRKSKTSTNYL